jgi:hypothetical protein
VAAQSLSQPYCPYLKGPCVNPEDVNLGDMTFLKLWSYPAITGATGAIATAPETLAAVRAVGANQKVKDGVMAVCMSVGLCQRPHPYEEMPDAHIETINTLRKTYDEMEEELTRWYIRTWPAK